MKSLFDLSFMVVQNNNYLSKNDQLLPRPLMSLTTDRRFNYYRPVDDEITYMLVYDDIVE